MRMFAFTLLLSLMPTSLFSLDRAHGNRVDFYFNILKGLPVDYGLNSSAVEEEIARLDLYQIFNPKDFKIEKNLSYRSNKRTLGELDVVVFSRKTGRVVLIGEVKRKSHAHSATNEAYAQLQRFETAIKNHSVVDVKLAESGKSVNLSAFQPPWDKRVIGVEVPRENQYKYALSINSEELAELREKLIDHQTLEWERHRKIGQTFKNFMKSRFDQYQNLVRDSLYTLQCADAFL